MQEISIYILTPRRDIPTTYFVVLRNVDESEITRRHHVGVVLHRNPILADHVQSARGGGIGGLTLAAALRSMGNEQKLDVHIYESSSVIAEIGAGISFWPRSWRIMKAIGAHEKLFELLSEVPDDSTSKSIIFIEPHHARGPLQRNCLTSGKVTSPKAYIFRTC